MKMTVLNGARRNVIQYEEWPVDCLVRFLDKKQRLLLGSLAPKIVSCMDSVNTIQSGRSALQQLDDLFTSCVNRLVIRMARQTYNERSCSRKSVV